MSALLKKYGPAALLWVLPLLLCATLGYDYEVNDDPYIIAGLRGQLCSSPISSFAPLEFMLGWDVILSNMYKMLPGLPWYGLAMHACLSLGAWLYVELLRPRLGLGWALVAVMLTWLLLVPAPTFTRIGIWLGLAGIWCLLYRPLRSPYTLLAGLAVVMAYGLRPSGLFFAGVLAVLSYPVWRQSLAGWRHLARRVALLVAIVGPLHILGYLHLQAEPDIAAYNDERVTINDKQVYRRRLDGLDSTQQLYAAMVLNHTNLNFADRPAAYWQDIGRLTRPASGGLLAETEQWYQQMVQLYKEPQHYLVVTLLVLALLMLTYARTRSLRITGYLLGIQLIYVAAAVLVAYYGKPEHRVLDWLVYGQLLLLLTLVAPHLQAGYARWLWSVPALLVVIGLATGRHHSGQLQPNALAGVSHLVKTQPPGSLPVVLPTAFPLADLYHEPEWPRCVVARGYLTISHSYRQAWQQQMHGPYRTATLLQPHIRLICRAVDIKPILDLARFTEKRTVRAIAEDSLNGMVRYRLETYSIP